MTISCLRENIYSLGTFLHGVIHTCNNYIYYRNYLCNLNTNSQVIRVPTKAVLFTIKVFHEKTSMRITRETYDREKETRQTSHKNVIVCEIILNLQLVVCHICTR